jgi:Aldose 1-epimerase
VTACQRPSHEVLLRAHACSPLLRCRYHVAMQERLQEDASGSYFGCIVGRVANRTKNASFSTSTCPVAAPDAQHETYQLEANDGAHALHGGAKHWGRHRWAVGNEKHGADSSEVTFSRISEDGEGGYPGRVDVSVRYVLSGHSGGGSSAAGGGAEEVVAWLRVFIKATPTKATPINMVQHTHWSLAGRRAAEQVRSRSLLLLRCRVAGRAVLLPAEQAALPSLPEYRLTATNELLRSL